MHARYFQSNSATARLASPDQLMNTLIAMIVRQLVCDALTSPQAMTVQMTGRERRRRRWGAPRTMLFAGAPLPAEKRGATPRANCERRAFPAGRRDGQLDGPNAPGWAAREERAATSVRRAGGEAPVWALDFAPSVQICRSHGSSAQTVASAAARFAGRGPFLTLRRCAGDL